MVNIKQMFLIFLGISILIKLLTKIFIKIKAHILVAHRMHWYKMIIIYKYKCFAVNKKPKINFCDLLDIEDIINKGLFKGFCYTDHMPADKIEIFLADLDTLNNTGGKVNEWRK